MKRILLLLIIAAIVTSPLLADGGRIPLYEPTTITVPGNYVLTRDLMAAAGPVLNIQVENVTVDLNGFTIQGADPSQPTVLFSPPPPKTTHSDHHFRLFGGTILGGLHGVHATSAERRNVILRDLYIGGAADSAVRMDHVGALEARGIIIVNSRVGFDLLCQPPQPCGPAAIHDANIQASIGVQCTGVACTVADSLLLADKTAIRFVDAVGGALSVNRILICPPCFNPQPEPPISPFEMLNSPNVTIAHNTVRGDPTSNGSRHGIFVDATSHHALIMDNTITGNGDDGIRVLSMNSLIQNNLIADNGGHGIFIGGSDNLVESNKVGSNGGDGLNFDAGDNHVYRGNVLLGNDGSAVTLPAAGTVVDAGQNVE